MATAAVLAFAAELVRARDPESLYEAFASGIPALIPRQHSMVASFHFRAGAGGAMSLWSTRQGPPRSPEWWARNNALHPALPFVMQHVGVAVVCVTDVVTDADLDAHPYYIEFMEPEGWRYGLALLVWHDDALVGLLAINRTAAQGDFSVEERELARSLQPIIVAAWERIAGDRRDEDARRAQQALLATLPIAAIVYSSRTDRVLFSNRAAREALAHWRGDGARKRPRKLSLPDELKAACASLPRGGVELRSGTVRAQLRKMDARAHFENDVVLVIIDDGALPGAPGAGWLHVARTLSTAEQAVAKLAARGDSNADIARQLGKSGATVKKQLESVFAKVHVANRSELAAVVAGLRSTRSRRRSRR